LAIDPLREDWHRLILRLYARYRGQGEALAHARYFTEELQRELHVAPDGATEELIRQIRNAEISTVSPQAIASVTQGKVTYDEDLSDTPATGATNPNEPLLSGNRFAFPPLQRVTAGVVLSSLLVAVAIYTLVPRLPWLKHGTDLPTTVAPLPSDAWQSPRLPSRPTAEQPHATIIPIAVLPFRAYGETANEADRVAEMLTDDIINTLARVPLLRVISRQTSRRYRGKDLDVGAVGRELAVQYILEGSVQRSAGNLRVNVELIDPKVRAPVWSTRIERSDGDNRAVQDEMVGRLARELQIELYVAKGKQESGDRAVDILNYKGFAALLGSSTVGLAALTTAESYFQQALVLDPKSLAAKRGLGAFNALVGVLMLVPDHRAHLAKAETILQEVVRDDPSASSAHYFLGLTHEVNNRLDEALRSYERSVELNASNALGHAQIGHILIAQGHPTKALEHIRYAQRLSPHDPHQAHWLRFTGEAHLELEDYDQAISALKQSYALNPRSPPTLRALVAAYAAAGNIKKSKVYLEELMASAPHITQQKLLERTVFVGHQPTFLRGLRLAVGSPRRENDN
jgi:TolB-like protein/cytochrome c-type biogenesis protein CcmH/NrfG